MHWTAKELEILNNNYLTKSISSMKELLPKRSQAAIQWKASQMGLLIRNGKKIRARNKIIVNITDEQLAFLKNIRNHSRIVREALDYYKKMNSIR